MIYEAVYLFFPLLTEEMNTGLIIDFLNLLIQHNSREWMAENKGKYEAAKEAFNEIIEELIFRIGTFDASVAHTETKHAVLRLHRDVRFSKDKTPYKRWFAAVIAPGGKKSDLPFYYLRIGPQEESMIAGGIHQPRKEILHAIRQEIDYNGEQLDRIIKAPAFTDAFGSLTGDRLLTTPKGYDKDHAYIELLRYKSLMAQRQLNLEDVLDSSFADTLTYYFKLMKPLNDYLSMSIRENI